MVVLIVPAQSQRGVECCISAALALPRLHRPVAAAAASCCRRRTVAAAGQQRDLNTQTIDNLPEDFCDEFVCTSSPSVEAGVRAAARCIQRANGKWGASQLASTVEYQDPVRRFRGPGGYSRLDFIPTCVASPSIEIQKMRMEDNATAVIDWQLLGQVGPFPVLVLGSTRLTLNLLTGRIERQVESWDLSRCQLPGRLAWSAAAAAWAARQASTDAAEGAERVIDTLTSFEEEDTISPPTPGDPTKWFFNRDTRQQDMLQFAAVVALFWALATAWGNLQGF